MSGPPPSARWRPWRFGLRREVLVLVPAAFVLLVVVSIFTLASYASAINLLVEQRQTEAARLARRLGQTLSRQGLPTSAELRNLSPQAQGIAILNAEGWPLVSSGDLPAGNLLGNLLGNGMASAATETLEPVGFGPDDQQPAAVAGVAPLVIGGTVHYARVDLPAAVLGAHRRSVRVLMVVVVALDAAVILLVLLFLRHLMRPFETLLDRARQVPGQETPETDDVTLLVSTLERAVAALSVEPKATASGGAEDDIANLARTLSTSLESGLLLLDRQGRVLSLNPLGARLLAVAPEPGTPLEDALAPVPALRGELAEAVAGRQGIQRREITVERQGEPRTLGVTVHPLRRDEGPVRGYLVLFTDLTDVQKQAEEARMAESLAQLGELAGGVAHELRNSLATLRGYLSLIEREPEEENIADYLGEIRHETEHLQRILEDFLTFARPGSVRPEDVALEAVVRRAMADPALKEVEPGAAIVLKTVPPDSRLQGDPQLLERAIRNLLHNAVKAQREADRHEAVEVELHRLDDRLELTIADRGRGVPESLRATLFQPFQAGFRGGVGLGLALTYRIVALHRGSLRLDDRDGGGTVAVVRFPAGNFVTEGSEALSISDPSETASAAQTPSPSG